LKKNDDAANLKHLVSSFYTFVNSATREVRFLNGWGGIEVRQNEAERGELTLRRGSFGMGWWRGQRDELEIVPEKREPH